MVMGGTSDYDSCRDAANLPARSEQSTDQKLVLVFLSQPLGWFCRLGMWPCSGPEDTDKWIQTSDLVGDENRSCVCRILADRRSLWIKRWKATVFAFKNKKEKEGQVRLVNEYLQQGYLY
jgi:hypothetical protein